MIYTITYKNGNGYVFYKEMVDLDSREAAHSFAYENNPMGPCGLYQIYDEGEWQDLQDKLDAEDAAYAEKVRKEYNR